MREVSARIRSSCMWGCVWGCVWGCMWGCVSVILCAAGSVTKMSGHLTATLSQGAWAQVRSAKSSPELTPSSTPSSTSSKSQAQGQSALQVLISTVERHQREIREPAAAELRLAARARGAYQPSRWRSVGLSAQYQPALSGAVESGEDQLLITATIALGSGHKRRGEASSAAERAVIASLEARALSYALHAVELYLELWEKRTTHLSLKEAQSRLESATRLALSSSATSTLEALELEALLARRAALVDERELEWDAKSAEATKLLGSIDLSTLDALSADDQSSTHRGASPWRLLIDHLDQHPAIIAQRREAEATEREASAVAAQDPWTAQLGAGLTAVESSRWAMATLSLSAPLSSPAESQALELRHLAASQRLELGSLTRQLRGSFIAHEDHWRSVVARVTRLKSSLVALYVKREGVARAAFEARHIPLRRWIDAHVERVEAELDLIHGSAHLWVARAKAAVIARSMGLSKRQKTEGARGGVQR